MNGRLNYPDYTAGELSIGWGLENGGRVVEKKLQVTGYGCRVEKASLS